MTLQHRQVGRPREKTVEGEYQVLSGHADYPVEMHLGGDPFPRVPEAGSSNRLKCR